MPDFQFFDEPRPTRPRAEDAGVLIGGLPGVREDPDLDDREVRPDRSGHARGAARPAAGGPARPAPAARAAEAIRSRSTARATSRTSGGRGRACAGTRRSFSKSRWPSGGPRPGRSSRPRAASGAGRAARRVRRPASLRPDAGSERRRGRPRGRAGELVPDAPPAAGRGRVRQDARGAARDARRRRRGRPGRVARAHRGPGSAAPPLADRAARPAGPGRPARAAPTGRPGSPCSPALPASRRGARRCSTRRPARPGSSSARTRCWRTRCPSPTSASSSSTSSTASASSSATPCGPRGSGPPHLLVMTATPIPRTVAMTVFGDLDVSTLTELPVGRSPITTHVVPVSEKPHFLDRAWDRIREEVDGGSPGLRGLPADRRGAGGRRRPAARRTRRPPPGARPSPSSTSRPNWPRARWTGCAVELLHGRMHADAKDEVMRAFAAGEVDVLIATTVIEVGVDVPNATVMVVLDADRFGISQLHQLRGRIGRGKAPGCACSSPTARRRARPAPGWMPSPPRRTASRSPASTSRPAARATCSARRSRAVAPACGCSA